MADNLREEVVRMHAQLCSGISDPNRILIIYNLADSPKCVNEIASSLELSQPSVSRHLKIMRDCGIVRRLARRPICDLQPGGPTDHRGTGYFAQGPRRFTH